MNSTTKKELAGLRKIAKLTPEQVARRNAVIAREVEDGTPKADLVEVTGLTLPSINRIARTTFPATRPEVQAFADATGFDVPQPQARRVEVPSEGLTFLVAKGGTPAPKKAAPKKAAPKKAAPKATARKRSSEHVPPRTRKVRATGSTLVFGHASDMNHIEDNAPWVVHCVTHDTWGGYGTRHDARYTDALDFCHDCLALVKAAAVAAKAHK